MATASDQIKGQFIAFCERISEEIAEETTIDYVNENNRFSFIARPVLFGKQKCPACYADEQNLDIRAQTKKPKMSYFRCKKCNTSVHYPRSLHEKFLYFLAARREKKIDYCRDLEEVFAKPQLCNFCGERLVIKECKNFKTIYIRCIQCESTAFIKRNLVKEYLYGEGSNSN